MQVVSRDMVYAAPQQGMSAYEVSHYTRRDGVEKVRMRLLDIGDDLPGPRQLAFSPDNGQTWPETVAVPPPRTVPGGTLRSWPCAFYVDPLRDRQLSLTLEGLFPTDSSHHGAKSYCLRYGVSLDGGRTLAVDEQVIQRGYTPEHPIPGIWIGRNAFTNAATPSILQLREQRLLAVICKTVHGPDGEFYNPGRNWFWTEIQVLHGFWQADHRVDWHAGPIIALPPELASRGICEPCLSLRPDGRIFTVMRACNGGPNDPHSKLPCHKWTSVSEDLGATWSFPEPWRYDDGTTFFSPDSLSQLLPMADGTLYWLGNIAPTNPVVGGPREQLYIGEVDPETLRLRRDSLFLIAARAPDDPPTGLSNFLAHEDRVSGEIVLYLPWFVEQQEGKWGADSWAYRLRR